jgi:hypothetical protein
MVPGIRGQVDTGKNIFEMGPKFEIRAWLMIKGIVNKGTKELNDLMAWTSSPEYSDINQLFGKIIVHRQSGILREIPRRQRTDDQFCSFDCRR